MTPKDTIHLLHKAGCPPDVIAHAWAVAKYALEIVERYNERHRNPADIELVITGALLHDIGHARSNGIDRAVVGAEIAQAFGLDELIVRIIKRNIGAGIPKDDAERLGLQRENYLSFTAMNCATSVTLEKQNQSMIGELHS
ncbi:MAG: HDIG domain-containing protein [Euryarchaeota archaeon]|nr:HDIG domain-containing protein [Euryarchaeota archaeon]